MRASLARHIGAFKKALESLTDYYLMLTPFVSLNNWVAPQFPDPRSYRSLSTGTKVHFNYISRIDEKNLLFTAKITSGLSMEKVFMKFVHQYLVEAHQICASMGFAPNLRGFEGLASGWKMVVMNLIDEEYICLHEMPPPYRDLRRP